MNDEDMINDLGDLEKRNQEFDNLVKHSKIDNKYHTYNLDMIIEPPKELNDKIKAQERQPQSNLYQSSIIDTSQDIHTDKREDLERKRIEQEHEFRKSEALRFHRDIQQANEKAKEEEKVHDN